MGICWCKNENKITKKKSSKKIEKSNQIKNCNIKLLNDNCKIENHSNTTVIKKIGEIKGESIIISTNENSIILIFDYSSSIHIQNCENCSFLLSPCSSLIQINNCKKINVILAAAQIRIANIINGNFYSYTCSPIIIESCKNICLGNFFVQYTELPEMFHKSNLNIWNNRWSQYYELGENENIFYDSEENKNIVLEEFINVFNESFINYDQYQFLPYTYGKSINLSNNLFKNVLIIFKSEDFCEEELLKQITPDELEDRKIKFISSLVLQDNNNDYGLIVEKIIKSSKNEELIDYLKNKNYNNNLATLSKNSLNLTKCTPKGKGSSKLNIMDLTGTIGVDSNRKFLQIGDILLLWFISDNIYIDNFRQYILLLYEPCYFGWITNEDFDCEENVFQENLSNFFFK